MSTEQAARALEQAKAAAEANPTAETVGAFMAAQDALRAERAAVTPHVLRAPAKQPPRMSGPRYFNLMRAIEADAARGGTEYADYRPTTYCGAPRTDADWDRRAALAAKNTKLVAEAGVCPTCLRLARG